MKILFVADIFGRPGRRIVAQFVPQLKKHYEIDVCIGNCENIAGGLGVTPKTAKEIFSSGIDILTSGNHLWDRKEIIDYLAKEKRILKPANYPPGVPGNDYYIQQVPSGRKLAILNLQGRTFIQNIDCPFRIADKFIKLLANETNLIFVDFHGEATAEKMAFAWYVDGRVSAVVGTHTHIQTADERVLPKGTAYITDAGMTGPHNSVIGIKIKNAVERFIKQTPNKFEVAKKNLILNGVIIEINEENGKAISIERLQIPELVQIGKRIAH